MQRRWQVHPDETGIVSREALISAFIDAATMLDIAGGTLSVVTGRMPTGLPGEMVTTGAVFEWRDRTDAKPQPERSVTIDPPVEQAGLFESTEPDDEPPPGVVVDDFEEQEDVSAIPEHAR